MSNNTFRQVIEKPRNLLIADIILALPFLVLPLMISLPYRVNIFLSWEGSYRMYLGQVPFQDFGMPMGYGYWMIPTLFFKIFGPTFLSLIYAQVVINLMGWAALRGILYNLKIRPVLITLSLLVFSLTYIVYNFWPWYNQAVVMFELVALYFITRYSSTQNKLWYFGQLILAALFSFITLWTKQDVGGMGFMICVFLLCYQGWLDKTFRPALVYVVSFFVIAILFIYPFIDNEFGYWFNYGQPPHNSRITVSLLLEVMFETRILEKIYVLLILVGVIFRVSSWKGFVQDRYLFMAVVVFSAMILQSLVTRVSSPLPTDHMTYFHVFGFVGAAMFLPWEKWEFKPVNLALGLIVVGVVFSAGYWKYVSGIFKFQTAVAANDGMAGNLSKPWVKSDLKTMKHILIPQETKDGIKRIMDLPFAKNNPDLKVLNMSELTFLAYEMGYAPQKNQALWYHLNIGIFKREVDVLKQRIKDGYYDIVLFEDIPGLTHFYPYELRDELRQDYFLYDNFLAPRKLEDSFIDVYVKPDLATQFGLTQVNGRTSLVRE